MAGLQAVAIVDGSPDRSPPDWVGGLIRARIPVLAACRIDPALLDGEAGYRAWVAKHRLAGLRLADWAEALSAGAVDPTGLAARVHELEEALGWVELRGIASDAVVFGEEQPADDELGDERDDGPVERFRRQHLVSRARGIRAEEGRQVWAQVPSAEELWVPSEADYVPGHPGEVGLAPGVTVADIASGYGRVARRIAPLVSPGGAIVCVEKASVSLDRARRFAAEGGFTNILALQGLAQRLPLETDTFDLAIMEWAGQVMRTGATEAVAEMARVVRPGGRVIVTHRLVRLVLNDLGQADASSPDVFSHFQAAFAHADLEILTRRFWGCQDRLSDLPMALFEEQWLPRALDELRGRHYPPLEETADIYLTVIARKKPPAGA
ncbi:MAG TPA: class I SAM-dependent methyltransferase [Kofleriaceae bacterium]|nr:class I SAM-dependent methyltransferase [Kofleriaceae bacterium]